ncbi:MAG: ABC transporter permease [Nitriliruptoraceae bacterium]|nr:ABC transporter permease [Nitriliruptoraceae bacterium]
MSATRTVLLIAEREVRQRLRSRLFVWSTLVIALLLSAAAAAPAVIGLFGTDVELPDEPVDPEPVAIAVVGGLAADEQAALEQALGPVELTVVDDVDAVAGLLEQEAISFGIVPGERVLTAATSGFLNLRSFEADRAAEALGLLAALDGDVEQVGTVLGALPLTIEELDAGDVEDEAGRFLAANIGVVFLFGVLILYASMIINGVIEEKGSRVVELLVEAVPVRWLMAGKILGLGLVGLGQVLVLFGPPVAILLVTGGEFVPTGTGGLLGALLLWFVLGYALYAVMAAGLGALVSRPEEAQAVLTPANTLMIVGYFVGFFVIQAPDTTFSRIVAVVPFSAPYAMLVRQAVGDPAWWEIGAAIGLTLLTIVGLTMLAARLYEGGILRVGARVRVRDAWRAARD